MKLVIDRKRWLRGEGGENSSLLRPSDGKMCCLGFYGMALGYDECTLKNEPQPDIGIVTSDNDVLWSGWMFDRRTAPRNLGERTASDDVVALMSVNDSESTPDALRERKIVGIFAKHGVEVEFVD